MSVAIICALDKIDDIRRNGFAELPGFLTEDYVAALLEAVCPHLGKAESEFGTAKSRDITLSMYRRHASRRAMRDVVFNSGIKSILSAFMDMPFVEHAKVLVKAPKGPDTPWHQDGAFWHEFDPHRSMLSLWIALEPVVIENGCLQIMKVDRTVDELLHHEKVRDGLELEIPDTIVGEMLEHAEVLSMELRPGDALLFDSMAIHRALPNKTNQARIGLKIVFQDRTKRIPSSSMHISSMELAGIRGLVNRLIPCALTARRA